MPIKILSTRGTNKHGKTHSNKHALALWHTNTYAHTQHTLAILSHSKMNLLPHITNNEQPRTMEQMQRDA